MNAVDLGKTLKKLRMEVGITQSQAAEKINRKQQDIGHWETGYSKPDATTLFEYCQALGVSVNRAFGFPEVELPTFDQLLLDRYKGADPVTQKNIQLLLEIKAKDYVKGDCNHAQSAEAAHGSEEGKGSEEG